MTRALLVCLMFTACSSDSAPASCKLADVLDAERGDTDPLDCGHLPIGATMAELTDAKKCVTDAVHAKKSFEVVLDVQGTDSKVAHAYLGVRDGATFTVKWFSYDGDPNGGGGEAHPRTSSLSCADLRATTSCINSDLASSLCLDCTDARTGETCRAP